MKKTKKFTTIRIYVEDLKILEGLGQKNETFADILHRLLNFIPASELKKGGK